jgi:hypoxanthine phosphoribosyltransferase
VGGYERKEIFFSPEPVLRERNILLVDAVLHSGVTLDFWAKRLLDSRPKSLRTAVLIDKPKDRKVDFQPDYYCFRSASNYLVGYGLPERRGMYRNLPFVGALSGARRSEKKPAGAKAKRSRRKKRSVR